MKSSVHSGRPTGRPMITYALSLAICILGCACASPPVRTERERPFDDQPVTIEKRERASLNDIARQVGARIDSRGRSDRVIFEIRGAKAEIARKTRVAYIDSELVLMPRPAIERAGVILIDRQFGDRLAHWARSVRRPAPKTVFTPKPVVRKAPLKIVKPDLKRGQVLNGFTIVIDPGHGGKDPGALAASGLMEKTVALDVALDLRDRLERAGARVLMTRDRDVFIPLERRAGFSNAQDTDVFVSIHANGANRSSAKGIEVFRAKSRSRSHRRGKLGASSRLAHEIYREIKGVSRHRDRGVKDSPGFRVLKKNRHPSVLVELGFLTNRAEAELLSRDAYRNELAAALERGIINYYRSATM